MGGIEPGGPGRPGGLTEGARGGGAGGSIRGDGLASRLPLDFTCEFEDIGVRVVGPMGPAEPERAGRGMRGAGERASRVRYHQGTAGVNDGTLRRGLDRPDRLCIEMLMCSLRSAPRARSGPDLAQD